MTKQDFMKLSLAKLEDLTDMDRTAWSRWFSGRVAPKLDKLEEVAQPLQMTAGELVDALIQRRSQTLSRKRAAALANK